MSAPGESRRDGAETAFGYVTLLPRGSQNCAARFICHRQTEKKSDLDFLVDFERPTYDNFLGLSKDLERLLGRKVDILTPQGLESIRVKSIAESIRKTLAYV